MLGTLAPHKGCVHIKELRGIHATKEAVLAALATAAVLHYCGHAFFDGPGENQGGLLLAGREKLTLRDLKESSAMPRVVFFNACEAGRVRGLSFDMEKVVTEGAAFAELVLTSGVEAYIGTYWRVGDESAAEFASGVYTRFSEGKPLESAMTESRAALFRNKRADWANYILYGEGRFRLIRARSN